MLQLSPERLYQNLRKKKGEIENANVIFPRPITLYCQLSTIGSMAKSKSSASSATRKKQAAKQAKKKNPSAGDEDETHTPQKPQRGQKKQKKDRFAPKVKSYVPPPPPPKGAVDPVDLYLITQGKQIDPELVVVLRRLGKKDEATIGKGVEGFDAAVREVLRREKEKEGEDWERELKEEEIIECIAVWVSMFHTDVQPVPTS